MNAEAVLTRGNAECPACGVTIEVQDVMLNEIIECDDCASEFEIIGLEPLALEALAEDEEDYGE